MTPYDYVGAIVAYENGELSDDDTIEFFQYLVDTGHAWTLQGHYGRTAMALLEAGHITRNRRQHNTGRWPTPTDSPSA